MSRGIEKHLLFVGVAVALAPVLVLRDFTPANELRYLSIADEALAGHTFFAFTNHGVPYADKPPLYLWIVMLCRWLTGAHRMWLLALFSLLPALGIVRTMDRWVEQEMDSRSRVLAQWLLLSCGLFIGAAVTLRMDMLMCFFIVLALHAFWRILDGGACQDRYRWLFPLYLFLAVFTKGPLGLLVPLCSTAVFLCASRRMGAFVLCWGMRTWGMLLACCAMWFGAVYAEGGAAYLHNMLVQQTFGRAVHSFHHARPLYYYAVHIWYSLAPWSLLIVGVLAAVLRRRLLRSDLQNFFLTVGATTLALLSFISSKLQIYMLPAVPFLVYASAMFLHRVRGGCWLRLSLAVPSVLFTLLLPALIVLRITGDAPYLHEGAVYAASAVLAVGGAYSLFLLYGRHQAACVDTVVRRLASALLCALFVGALGLPGINAYTGYGALCREANELSGRLGIHDFRSWQLPRPANMDVYLHAPVTAIDKDSLPSSAGRPYLLLTRKRCLNQFQEAESHPIGSYAVVVMQGEP